MLRINFIVALAFLTLTYSVIADDGEAVRKAVTAVAARLVRIETIGGREKVGAEFANEGASTGFLLDAEGFVITSAFHFIHEPTSILLRFSDGSKKVARRICTDQNRMLTLLKAENFAATFVALTVTPKAEIAIGGRCIAVGMVLSEAEPNIALGIVSGKERIWGKAIQTDASIGPNNYGGPLIDFDGKLLGLLVPLSIMSSEVTAGAEMYDAGVGMAIPFEDIFARLAKMQAGVDLLPGTMGIGFKENRIFIGEPVIDVVEPDSPAAVGGMQKDDRILALNGEPISTARQATQFFRSQYAGETVMIRFRRGDAEQEISLTTAKPQAALSNDKIP